MTRGWKKMVEKRKKKSHSFGMGESMEANGRGWFFDRKNCRTGKILLPTEIGRGKEGGKRKINKGISVKRGEGPPRKKKGQGSPEVNF